MIGRRKFIVVTKFLLIMLAIVACVVGWSAYSNQTSDTNISKSIVSYEDCVLANGYLSNSRAVLAPEIGFTCEINRITHNAKFQRCAIGECKDIDSAFQIYCYEPSENKAISEVLKQPIYSSSVLVRDGFARGSIYCDEDKDKLLTVYLSKDSDKWRHFLTISEHQNCDDIDHKDIPLSISGTCYDSTAGWRAPVN